MVRALWISDTLLKSSGKSKSAEKLIQQGLLPGIVIGGRGNKQKPYLNGILPKFLFGSISDEYLIKAGPF